MNPKSLRKTKPLHRSFSLNAELVAEALRVMPRELSGNLNRMMNVALAELVQKYKTMKLEAEMARMAADAALSRESKRISREFSDTESEG